MLLYKYAYNYPFSHLFPFLNFLFLNSYFFQLNFPNCVPKNLLGLPQAQGFVTLTMQWCLGKTIHYGVIRKAIYSVDLHVFQRFTTHISKAKSLRNTVYSNPTLALLLKSFGFISRKHVNISGKPVFHRGQLEFLL